MKILSKSKKLATQLNSLYFWILLCRFKQRDLACLDSGQLVVTAAFLAHHPKFLWEQFSLDKKRALLVFFGQNRSVLVKMPINS